MELQSIRMERMLGELLRLPSEAIIARIASELVSAGFDDLTPAQFMVFRVMPAEGARTTELAERARMTKQSMSALVRPLVDRGYVRSEPDPDDRRAAIITRTERGWEVERIARAAIAGIMGEWRDALGPDRFDAGIEMLEALAEHIESRTKTAFAAGRPRVE